MMNLLLAFADEPPTTIFGLTPETFSAIVVAIVLGVIAGYQKLMANKNFTDGKDGFKVLEVVKKDEPKLAEGFDIAGDAITAKMSDGSRKMVKLARAEVAAEARLVKSDAANARVAKAAVATAEADAAKAARAAAKAEKNT